MKKIPILTMLAAGLCLCALSACGGAPQTQIMRTAAADDSGTAVRLTSQLHEKEYKSSDGKVLLGKYSYTLPAMAGAADDEASAAAVDAFNGDMASILKEESGSWDEAMKEAEELYSDFSSDNWGSGIYWTDEINYESHQTNTLVSLRFEHYVFFGGVHGYTYYTSYLFAQKEGREITLADMTDDAQTLSQTVTDEILRQIDEKDLNMQYGYWGDYAVYVAEWMDGYSAYFNDEGELEIIFPAYDLACYAAGAQTFVIPQSVYAPCLNDYGRLLLGIS
ncbi:MAG: RsiV family protein [Clostridiales bacterium]|nr:RsiV family protein [Clostridiales bacterium]